MKCAGLESIKILSLLVFKLRHVFLLMFLLLQRTCLRACANLRNLLCDLSLTLPVVLNAKLLDQFTAVFIGSVHRLHTGTVLRTV